MRIIEPTGDDPIGAALVRLARRAAAMHRFEAAKRAQQDAAAGGTDRTLSSLGDPTGHAENLRTPEPAGEPAASPEIDPAPYEEARR